MLKNAIADSLPKDARKELEETLKYFTECYVFVRNGKFDISTGIAITSEYNIDEKYIGRVKINELYTKEEQKRNYREAWG